MVALLCWAAGEGNGETWDDEDKKILEDWTTGPEEEKLSCVRNFSFSLNCKNVYGMDDGTCSFVIIVGTIKSNQAARRLSNWFLGCMNFFCTRFVLRQSLLYIHSSSS